MATLVGRGFSYERPRCVSGGVGGQFRPEGWHQVWVGLIGRVGGGMWGGRGVGRLRLLRRFSRCRLEVVCLPFSELSPGDAFVPSVLSLSAPDDTLSGDVRLPPDRLRRTDSRPERSQPVRTSSGSASSTHAYRSAHPPWAVPDSLSPSLSSPHDGLFFLSFSKNILTHHVCVTITRI